MMSNEVTVKVAELQAATPGKVLVTLGLGSCVGIALHDATARVAGLAHILLPSRSLSRQSDAPGRFPQSAVPLLIAEMVKLGADPRRLTARLVGGASMFANLAPPGSIQMGDRNVVACREVLSSQGIPVIAEAVGGASGRSMWFHPDDGRIEVRSVGKPIRVL
jgi:chemotaxis protein CheD